MKPMHIQKIIQSIGIIFLLLANTCFAENIIIAPNTVISHSRSYNNATLDMTNGSFIINNNATLTITNCIINGNISKKNPLLITVDKGKLNLSHNNFNIKSVGIDPHPTTQSLHYVIQLAHGGLNMDSNSFVVDHSFEVGLLITSADIQTTGINIVRNTFERFHGVIYLLGTDNALISDNILTKNTYGNIVIIGSNSKILGNTIYYSGNNRLGNSIDLIDSNNILVSKNLLLTPTCHGIYVFNSSNVVLDSNRVNGGITYAMSIITYPEKLKTDDEIMPLVLKHTFKNVISQNITITNNFMSQNRYGIAATDVNGLDVENNIFIQRFEDVDARKFWTNNNILLQNVSQLTWVNNMYKEAFTQEVNGDNTKTDILIPFPKTGGISL